MKHPAYVWMEERGEEKVSSFNDIFQNYNKTTN